MVGFTLHPYKYDCSIQLGDFGFKKEHDMFKNQKIAYKNKILFGNHDYYPYLNENYSLGDYRVFENKIMTIRGACSIDKNLRIEGRDWFPNEEFSYKEAQNIFDVYCKTKPSVVISHDCPQSIREVVFNINDKSITSNLLEACYMAHKPKLWLFGHHHQSTKIKCHATSFICLDELEPYMLDSDMY